MSRCFPYPPPGYSRNGATYEALIESIKLQKENDKAKAERKKEKRAKKEKKEKKEKRKDSDKSKLQKNPNESQQDSHSKQLQTSIHLKEQIPPLNIKRKELAIEQLEKSDLTEEHGQPIDSNKPSYSSDSTQNSNKRKRDDPVVPDDSSHVKPIKIRLFKKQKGPDSVKETSCSNSGRSDQQNLSKVPSLQSNYNSINGHKTPIPIPIPVSVTSNRKSGIPATSTSYDRKKSAPVSLQSRKSDVAVVQSSRRQQQQQQPIPIPGCRRKSENVIPIPSTVVHPAPSLSRKIDAAMVSSSGRMSIDEIKLPICKNEKKKDPISEIPLNVGPTTRFEKKLHKKHLKYEKLIGSWVPPVLEAQVAADGGGDDWLLGSRKTRGGAMSAMKDDVETCREMTWQPCARFLVEADVYALPYTVPF